MQNFPISLSRRMSQDSFRIRFLLQTRVWGSTLQVKPVQKLMPFSFSLRNVSEILSQLPNLRQFLVLPVH